MTKTKKAGALPSNMSLDKEKQKEFSQSVKDRKKKDLEFGTGNVGVCYIGHIPRGFHEEAMKGYFSQFGKVNKLRVARSKKTGNPKGYAFVEFANDAVAQLTAETMNNYLMFHKLLKCQYLPLTKVHPKTFKGANRPFRKPTSHIRARIRHNCEKSEETMKDNQLRAQKNAQKKLAKLAELGIEFTYPGLVSISANSGDMVKETKLEEEEDDEDRSTTRSMKKIEREAIAMINEESAASSADEEGPQKKRSRKASPVQKIKSGRRSLSTENTPPAKRAKMVEKSPIAVLPKSPKVPAKSPKVAKKTPQKVQTPVKVAVQNTPQEQTPAKSPKVAKKTPQKALTPASATVKKTPQKQQTPAKSPKVVKKVQTPAKVAVKTPQKQQTPAKSPTVAKKTPQKAQTPAKSPNGTKKVQTPAKVAVKTPQKEQMTAKSPKVAKKAQTPVAVKKTPLKAQTQAKSPKVAKSTPKSVSKKTPQRTPTKSSEKAKK